MRSRPLLGAVVAAGLVVVDGGDGRDRVLDLAAGVAARGSRDDHPVLAATRVHRRHHHRPPPGVLTMLLRALPVLVAAALSPAPAAASTVRVEAVNAPGGPASAVRVEAAGGETNDVAVDVREDGAFVVRDTAGVAPGAGCTAVDARTAACRSVQGTLSQLLVALGDGDDRFAPGAGSTRLDRHEVEGGTGADALALGTAGVARGGPGADRLTGSPGSDSLFGGPGDDVLLGGAATDALDGGGGRDVLAGEGGDDGLTDGDGAAFADWPMLVLEQHPIDADQLDGGPGTDSASYAMRRDAVAVDLAADTGGGRGEGDRLAGIENTAGGAGKDRLAGDEDPNRIDGGPGDTLLGRGGDDRLWAPGARADGGAGDDQLTLRGTGTARCGPGDDVADRPHSTLLLDAGCERLRITGGVLVRQRLGARAGVVTVRGLACSPKRRPRGALRTCRLVLRLLAVRRDRGGTYRQAGWSLGSTGVLALRSDRTAGAALRLGPHARRVLHAAGGRMVVRVGLIRVSSTGARQGVRPAFTTVLRGR